MLLHPKFWKFFFDLSKSLPYILVQSSCFLEKKYWPQQLCATIIPKRQRVEKDMIEYSSQE